MSVAPAMDRAAATREHRQRAFPELIAALGAALEAEHDALIGADAGALEAAADTKLQALEAVDALCRNQPAALNSWKGPLRDAMVANARNQALLSVLRTRVETRMQTLGLLDATYARDGRRATPLSSRSVRL